MKYRHLSHNGTNLGDKHRLQQGYKVSRTLFVAVTHTSRCSHFIPHLIDLHRLPVCQCIEFKWCLLVFKCLQTGLPPYFHSDLTFYSCILNTRRSNPSNNYLTMVCFDHKVYKSKRWYCIIIRDTLLSFPSSSSCWILHVDFMSNGYTFFGCCAFRIR